METASKTVVITGGSSGLGLAMAGILAERGYTPVILARNPDKIEAALGLLKPAAPRALGIPCDVTDITAVGQAVAQVKSQFQAVDFLILNAGVVTPRLLADHTDPEDLRRELEIDLWGAVLPTQQFLPLLNAPGNLLFISSGFGLVGTAGYAAYGAAKAGMIHFAESMRRELLHRRITVQVACPADIDTPQYHDEKASLPDWMQMAEARGTVMPAREAAEKILRRTGKSDFLIIINREIHLLQLMKRLLPASLLRGMLDRMFPLPQGK